ncbi:MAG: hypothetical protein GKR91_16620 [Pseudomonadales bacterium]|nr:hypothetical protein [Pseudomonadales bacterium]
MLNPEHVLIPFQVSPLPPGPWLIFAPHADDESFGMGGSLLKAKKEGVETHVVVLTDGALGGNADDLVEIRNQEASQAAKLLGLESLRCWSEPDRGLSDEERLIEKALEEINSIKPSSVFFPGPMEIHPDHRATGFLVWQAVQRAAAAAIKPQAIAYEIGVQNPVNFFIDVTAQKEEKEKVMDIYASQNSENNYPELVISLDKGRTFSLPPEVKYAEGFFRFSEEDLNQTFAEAAHKILDLYQ